VAKEEQMATLKQGDRVIITAREQTAADAKSGLYYPHFADMRGRILKVYGEEASVLVDNESLPTEVRVRHEEGEAAERQKYLDRLSETAKSSLGDKEKNFKLRYAVLVGVKDLSPDDGKSPKKAVTEPTTEQRAEAKVVAQAMKAVDPVTGESVVAEADDTASAGTQFGTDSAAKRLSETDLDKAEEEFLRQRQAGGDGNGKKK